MNEGNDEMNKVVLGEKKQKKVNRLIGEMANEARYLNSDVGTLLQYVSRLDVDSAELLADTMVERSKDLGGLVERIRVALEDEA